MSVDMTKWQEIAKKNIELAGFLKKEVRWNINQQAFRQRKPTLL